MHCISYLLLEIREFWLVYPTMLTRCPREMSVDRPPTEWSVVATMFMAPQRIMLSSSVRVIALDVCGTVGDESR
jgi:hypothetical protein